MTSPGASADGTEATAHIVATLRRSVEWADAGWIAFLFGENHRTLREVHRQLAGTPGNKRFITPLVPDLLLGSPDAWARQVAETAAGETTLLLVDLVRVDLPCTGRPAVWTKAVRTALGNLNAVRTRLLQNPYGLVFVLPRALRADVPAWCPDLWSVRQFSLDLPPVGGPPPIEVAFDVAFTMDIPRSAVLEAESAIEREDRADLMEWCRVLRRVERGEPPPVDMDAVLKRVRTDVSGLESQTLVVVGSRTLNAASRLPPSLREQAALLATDCLLAAGDRPDALGGAAQAFRLAAYFDERDKPLVAVDLSSRAVSLTRRLLEVVPVGAWQLAAQEQHAASLMARASAKAGARDATARADAEEAVRIMDAHPQAEHLRVSAHLQLARIAWLEGDEGSCISQLDSAVRASARPGSDFPQHPTEGVRALAALLLTLTWLGRLECSDVVDAFGLPKAETIRALAGSTAPLAGPLLRATLHALAFAHREGALRAAVGVARDVNAITEEEAASLLRPGTS